MPDNERIRDIIFWTIEDIAKLQREMGCVLSDPGDREAYDIVARIERKLRAAGEAP